MSRLFHPFYEGVAPRALLVEGATLAPIIAHELNIKAFEMGKKAMG
jgi:hypothetical protein